MKRTPSRVGRILDPSVMATAAIDFEAGLRKDIIGQADAVHTITSVYQQYLGGLCNRRSPAGSFLLLGPTGNGKTLIAERTSFQLHGVEDKLVILDCAEFDSPHNLAKIVGAPPGYIGHKETKPLLSDEVLKKARSKDCPLAVVLFDEIEKADPSLFDLLLGILDKGRLTTGGHGTVDMTDTLVFMTSNVGAPEMASAAECRFSLGGRSSAPTASQVGSAVTQAMKRKFRPEFLNRIDEKIVCPALSKEDLEQVMWLELKRIQKDIMLKHGSDSFVFVPSTEAITWLLEKGTSLVYGARHLAKCLRREVARPLAALSGSGQIRSGDAVSVEVGPGGLVFRVRYTELLVGEIAAISDLVFNQHRSLPTLSRVRKHSAELLKAA